MEHTIMSNTDTEHKAEDSPTPNIYIIPAQSSPNSNTFSPSIGVLLYMLHFQGSAHKSLVQIGQPRKH